MTRLHVIYFCTGWIKEADVAVDGESLLLE